MPIGQGPQVPVKIVYTDPEATTLGDLGIPLGTPLKITLVGCGGGGGYRPASGLAGAGGGGGAMVIIEVPGDAWQEDDPIGFISGGGTGGTSGAQTGTAGGAAYLNSYIVPGSAVAGGGQGGGVGAVVGAGGVAAVSGGPWLNVVLRNGYQGQVGTSSASGAGGLGANAPTGAAGAGGPTPDSNGGAGAVGAVIIEYMS